MPSMEEDEKVAIFLRVSQPEKDRMLKLAHVAHKYKLTEKETLTAIITFGMNLAYDACQKEAAKRRGG